MSACREADLTAPASETATAWFSLSFFTLLLPRPQIVGNLLAALVVDLDIEAAVWQPALVTVAAVRLSIRRDTRHTGDPGDKPLVLITQALIQVAVHRPRNKSLHL